MPDTDDSRGARAATPTAPDASEVVVLAGGTGGAKLARGMLDVVGAEHLTVIANTGDDLEIYGAYVSPDPDLVSFWQADLIDPRGWGIDGDTFSVMDGLRSLGQGVWFNLGDRDLAVGLMRAQALAAGTRLTLAHAAVCRQLGVRTRVLPMSDQPVRTRILSDSNWWTMQEFMIKQHAAAEVEDVRFSGARGAGTTPEVLAALKGASAIVIGPSNPVISIGPMLAVPELRDALASSPAPVVAVSPLVNGHALKGPTAACMRSQGVEVSGAGITTLYAGVIQGLVSDCPLPDANAGPPLLETDLLMADAAGRKRLAQHTFEFALTLGRADAGGH